MRKFIYLLPVLFLLLLLPSSGSAFQGGPSGFKANPDQNGIKLEWLNNAGYDQQTLTKTGGPGTLVGVLQTKNNTAYDFSDPLLNQRSFLDPNLGQPTSNITTYQYQLQTTKGNEMQTDGTSVTFLDSNIVI